MKNLSFLLAAALLCGGNHVSAQTNLFITLTNSAGVLITNAEVVKIFPNKILYRSAAGGGMIQISALSPEIQKRLGFDPSAANAADAADAQKKAREQEVLRNKIAQSQVAARYEAQKKITEQTARAIIARVVQRLDDGLLVSGRSDDGLPIENYTEDESWKAWNNRWSLHRAEGIIFLADYPNQRSVGADDKFLTVAYPDGFFKYKTVNGSESIVHKYTSSLEKATMDALSQQ